MVKYLKLGMALCALLALGGCGAPSKSAKLIVAQPHANPSVSSTQNLQEPASRYADQLFSNTRTKSFEVEVCGHLRVKDSYYAPGDSTTTVAVLKITAGDVDFRKELERVSDGEVQLGCFDQGKIKTLNAVVELNANNPAILASSEQKPACASLSFFAKKEYEAGGDGDACYSLPDTIKLIQ